MRYSAILLAVGGLGLAHLGGCGYEQFPGQSITNDYRNHVPTSAESVGTGTGSVSYIATTPGTVYLIDYSRFDKLRPNDDKRYAPRVIGSYLLIKGQAIAVDGASQSITVGGTGNVMPTVFMNPNLDSENSYELRFEAQKMD